MKEYLKERYIVLIIFFWIFSSFQDGGLDSPVFFVGAALVFIWFPLFGSTYKHSIREIIAKKKDRGQANESDQTHH
jgi:hypothetical protein